MRAIDERRGVDDEALEPPQLTIEKVTQGEFNQIAEEAYIYADTGDGARLMMLVLHDDAEREYAYGPAQGLPDSKVGTFTRALYDEAKKKRLGRH